MTYLLALIIDDTVASKIKPLKENQSSDVAKQNCNIILNQFMKKSIFL